MILQTRSLPQLLRRSSLAFLRPSSSAMTQEETPHGPVGLCILEKLRSEFSPTELVLVNESGNHNVPQGSETHFKVLVVSSTFEGLPPLARHRAVNAVVEEELQNGVHALSILAKTPEQWKDNPGIDPSPKCRGGFGR